MNPVKPCYTVATVMLKFVGNWLRLALEPGVELVCSDSAEARAKLGFQVYYTSITQFFMLSLHLYYLLIGCYDSNNYPCH